MKVVLNQDIKGIGKKLQVVDVSEGYARNYLIPRKMASIADNKNINEAKTKVEAMNFKKMTEKQEAIEIKEKIEKNYLEFKHKVGDNGKLFGSITEKEIADKINSVYDINKNKKKIIIKNPIKEIGSYEVNVKLYEGVIANVKIAVVRL